MTTEIRKQRTTKTINRQINSKGPKDWWKTLKHFITPTSTSSVHPLCKQCVIYSDDMEKIEILNEHFYAQNTLDKRNASLPSVNFDHVNTLHTIHFTPSDVETVLNSLNARKVAGIDFINNRHLKITIQTTIFSPV